MSITKFGAHITTGNRDGYGLVAPYLRGIVTKLADAALDVSPNTFVVYRPGADVGIYTYEGQNDENIMPGFNDLSIDAMPAQADYWWPKIMAAVEGEETRLGISVDAIQCINEAEGDDPIVIAKLIAFELRLMELASLDNRVLVFGSYGPNSPHWDLWTEHCANFIKMGWEMGHIYGRHVYFDVSPFVENETRLDDELAYFENNGILVGPTIISEWGFVTFPGIDTFIAKVAEWELVLRLFPNVGFVAPFTYGVWKQANISDASDKYLEYLQSTNPITEKWQPQPYEAPPTSGGDYTAVVVKAPQEVTLDERLAICEYAFPFRHSVTPSTDDALAILKGGNSDSYAKIPFQSRPSQQEAIQIIENAGYRWETIPQFDDTPPGFEIIDIVNDLVTHPDKTYKTRLLEQITTLTIHHTAGTSSVNSVAEFHVNGRGWPGIAYHFFIEVDGTIYQTNYLDTISYHAGVVGEPGNNDFSIGIALQGNFTNSPPSSEQIAAVKWLVSYIQTEILKRNLYRLPHRHMPRQTTQCPGNTWDDGWFLEVSGLSELPEQPVSIKFLPDEVVAVTGASGLNVRSAPYGDILGVSDLSHEGVVLPDAPQNVGGFDWWRVDWNNGLVGWSAEDYLKRNNDAEPTPPIPPPPIDADKIDVLSFMIADPYAWRVVRHSSGATEDIQDMTLSNGYWVRRKGNNAEWWRTDGLFTYLFHDTSPGPDGTGKDRCYTIYKNGVLGTSPKNPAFMAMNEFWQEDGTHFVQFRYKNNCELIHSPPTGFNQNYARLTRYERDYTINGILLSDVIWLETTNGETQIYAKQNGRAIGWIGWESSWGNSELVELYWDRGAMTEEPQKYCNW